VLAQVNALEAALTEAAAEAALKAVEAAVRAALAPVEAALDSLGERQHATFGNVLPLLDLKVRLQRCYRRVARGAMSGARRAAREAAKLAGPEVRRFQSWAEEVNP
jgi:hypothetical protein